MKLLTVKKKIDHNLSAHSAWYTRKAWNCMSMINWSFVWFVRFGIAHTEFGACESLLGNVIRLTTKNVCWANLMNNGKGLQPEIG